jgi:hypothetical protein
LVLSNNYQNAKHKCVVWHGSSNMVKMTEMKRKTAWVSGSVDSRRTRQRLHG